MIKADALILEQAIPALSASPPVVASLSLDPSSRAPILQSVLGGKPDKEEDNKSMGKSEATVEDFFIRNPEVDLRAAKDLLGL